MIQTPQPAATYQTNILQALTDSGIRQMTAGGKARDWGMVAASYLALGPRA